MKRTYVGAKLNVGSRILIGLIIIFFLAVIILNVEPVHAQSGKQLDYIILIDVSGSMQDPSNSSDPQSASLWDKLRPVIQDYVKNLPLGANVLIYTFGTEISVYGPWADISESDKGDIQDAIDSFNPDQQLTRFWDTVCQGVQYMNNLQSEEEERFQTLISFTDGEDNASAKQASDCLGNYDDLCIEGNVYWIHYAYKDSETFGDSACTRVIDIEDPEVVPPITTVLIQPSVLNLGNIFETGSGKKCIVPWASYSDIYGTENFKIGQPRLIEGQLPSDITMNICESGTDCNREQIPIQQKESCLDIYLINYDKNTLVLDEPLHIIFEVPILEPDGASSSFVIYPEKIEIEFDLEPIPPTSTPTSTATQMPTPTVTATRTPLPTSTPTPVPIDAVIKCDGSSEIDLGVLKKPSVGQSAIAEKSCQIKWGDGDTAPEIDLTIGWDEEDEDLEALAQYIWVVHGGSKHKNIVLDEKDNEFTLLVEIPNEDWDDLTRGMFKGQVNLLPSKAFIQGDIEKDKRKAQIDVQFQVKPPLSPILYSIPGVIILVLAGLLIAATRPRFPKEIKIESMGIEVSPSSVINDWWTGAVYLGGGGKSALGLGNESDLLVRITPNMKGSFLGKILFKNMEFKAEVKPLDDAMIRVIGYEATTEACKVYDESEFDVLKGDEYYPVKFVQVNENDIWDPDMDDPMEDPFIEF